MCMYVYPSLLSMISMFTMCKKYSSFYCCIIFMCMSFTCILVLAFCSRHTPTWAPRTTAAKTISRYFHILSKLLVP